MKIIKKNVYYCDFCKKKGLSAGHMSTHEKHCTGNPDRICRLCGSISMSLPEITKRFRTRYKIHQIDKGENYALYSEKLEWKGKEITIDEINDHADDCPNCTLAIMRQSGLTHYLFIDILKFDYKKALAEYWKEKNYEEGRLDEQNYY